MGIDSDGMFKIQNYTGADNQQFMPVQYNDMFYFKAKLNNGTLDYNYISNYFYIFSGFNAGSNQLWSFEKVSKMITSSAEYGDAYNKNYLTKTVGSRNETTE